MIITDQFVLLNFPKTGSSFTRDVLKKVHGYNLRSKRLWRRFGVADSSGMEELLLPAIGRKVVYRQVRNQHGTYRQIPHQHRHKTIVTVVRNTFDRYVSGYLYGYWKKKYHEIVPKDELFSKFPNFPDLTFGEYYELIHLYGRQNKLNNANPTTELGVHTIHFVQFYFPNPEKVLEQIDPGFIDGKRYLGMMPEIVFLHQERLNEELHEFLLQCGYPAEQIDFIQQAAPINVTSRRPAEQQLEEFYTPVLVDQIIERDHLLFDLFPEYRPGSPFSGL